MKKTFNIAIYLILSILLVRSSMYSHAILQNNWTFIILFRIVFPLIITFAIFLSHQIYHTQKNVANLLLGWLLIIPGGFVSLFFVMGLKLSGFGILLPLFLSILLVIILDILIRRVALKIKIQRHFKEIKDRSIYYGILALMHIISVVLLTVVF